MKHKNQLKALPESDQKFILGLCDKHPYSKVVEILAQPRPTGLNLIVSDSALCRFYTQHHQLTATAILANQLGYALQVRRHSAPGACITGILALLEHRILHSLKEGRATADLAPDIRLFKTVHAAFLAESKARTENRKFDAPYAEYIEDQAVDCPAAEYIRPDNPEDLNDPGLSMNDYNCWDTDEGEIVAMRHALVRRCQAHDDALEQANAQKQSAGTTQNSTPPPPKTPAISHIPPNSTSSNAPTRRDPNIPSKSHPRKFHLPTTNPFIDQLSATEPPKSPVIPHIPPNSTLEIPPASSPFVPPSHNESAA